MNLKMISQTATPAVGLGNNWGETVSKVYECPCRKGTVTTEIDSITGHKSVQTSIDCVCCREKYTIVNPNSRNWDIAVRIEK